MEIPGRTFVVNSMFILFSLVFALAIAEIVSRIIPIANDTNPVYKLAHEVLPYVMKPNSEAVSLQGHLIKINSHGLRDYDYPFPKPEGTFRILVLGDSVAFAYGNVMEDGFTKILERKLNAVESKKYENFEVINTAHAGYNILDQYNYLRLKGLKYSPDLVVVSNYSRFHAPESSNRVIHDGLDSAPGSFWLRSHILSWIKRTLRKSYLYTTVGLIVPKIRANFRDPPQLSTDALKKRLQAIRGDYEKIISLASKSHFPIYFFAAPIKPEILSKTYRANPQQFHQQIRDFERDGRAVYIDTMGSFINFPGNVDDLFASNDPAHPNVKGHQIIADSLYDILVQQVL